MTEETYLIQLCKAFLHGAAPPNPSQPLDEERLIALSKEQKVIPITAKVLENSNFFSDSFQKKLQYEQEKRIWIDTVQQIEITSINSAFQEQGVRYLPLKGAVLKKLYPETWLRPMVDYDVLVEESHFDTARQILGKLGYRCIGFSEHNDGFTKPPASTVELHRKLMSELGGFKSALSASWDTFSPVSEGSLEYRFSWEDYYQYMIEHLMKHWIRSSVYLRDFVDISFFLNKLGPQLNRSQIEEAFYRKNILSFAHNIERLTQVWFDGEPSDSLTNRMTDYVFQKGDIGKWNDSLAFSMDLQNLDARHLRWARCLFLFRKIFCPDKARPSKNQRISSAPKILRPFLTVRYWLTSNFYVMTHPSYYRRFFRLWSLPDNALRRSQEFQKSVGLDIKKLKADKNEK